MVAVGVLTVPWRGCVLHRVHLPRPVRTHLHHRFPKYLQMKRYGKIVDPTTVNVCATGHDDVHAAIEALMLQKPMPKGVGRGEREMAREAVRRFLT